MHGHLVRSVIAIAIALLGGAVTSTPRGEAAPARAAANSATFEDATGEDLEGPDITTVAVSNDDAGGLRFRIAIPSHPVLTEDLRIQIWLDLDDDLETGLNDGTGRDHSILVDFGSLGFGAAGLATCSANSCGAVQGWPLQGAAVSLRFTYEAGVASFSLDASKLPPSYRLDPRSGTPRRVWFQVRVDSGLSYDPVTRSWDFTNDRWDFAPVTANFPRRDQLWVYDWRGPLLVKSFSARPAIPRAGRPFALRLAAVRTDTGAPVTSGSVTCSSRVAGQSFYIRGKPLRPESSGFVGGRAVCVFSIPANATGWRFRATISVTFAGTRVTRSVSGTVR
jgi:hypothetical protein